MLDNDKLDNIATLNEFLLIVNVLTPLLSNEQHVNGNVGMDLCFKKNILLCFKYQNSCEISFVPFFMLKLDFVCWL